ncbi:MAG: hypothetical protein JNN01_11635 [Opitutaceae bacterium]|nr:hypothetical protein [Opitutaceae bacterium]
MAEFATPYTDLLDYDVFTRVDDALRGGVAPHPAILALQPSMVAWLEALAASRENKKAEAKAKKDKKAAKAAAPAEAAPVTPGSDTPEPEADTGKRGLATIAVRECVVPGVPFHSEHFLDTEFAGDSMLGLYLLALAAFASEQKLGGGSARGYGRFSLRTTIHTSEGTFDALQLGADGKYTPNEKVESISRAIDAWNAYAADVTAAKLEAIFSCAQAA